MTQNNLYLYSVGVDLLWVWGRLCSYENLLNIVTFVQIFVYSVRKKVQSMAHFHFLPIYLLSKYVLM